MDDAGLALLRSIETLMREVRDELRVSRDSRETSENAALREKADQLDSLRKSASERRKRNRLERKSRDSRETNVKQPESLSVVSQDSRATPQVVKDLDLDQLRKEKSNYLQRTATVARQAVNAVPKPATGPVWLAYSTAYEAKYQAKPVRNAKVNGQLTQLVKRLGDNAAEVAAFYVGHAGAYYGQRGHCVDALLRDAEKLHTEWETGRQITTTATRQQDKSAANLEGWNRLLKEPKNGLG